MPIPTIVSLKSGGLILGIVVSAVGLNMSVLQLNEVTEPSEQSALAPVSTAPEHADMALPISAPTAEVVASTVTTTLVQTTSTQPQPSTSAASSTASTSTSSTTSAPPPQATAPSTEYLSYTFDGIAEIVVAFHDGERMEFWSVVPEPGWSFNVETQTATKIEIEFGFGHDEKDHDDEDDEYEDDEYEDDEYEDEQEAEFELKLVDGQIRVKAER